MILEVEIQLMITLLIIWMIPSLLASWKWNTEDIMKMAAIKLYYSQNDNDVKKKVTILLMSLLTKMMAEYKGKRNLIFS